jgi:hypothetical protein
MLQKVIAVANLKQGVAEGHLDWPPMHSPGCSFPPLLAAKALTAPLAAGAEDLHVPPDATVMGS